MEKQQITVNVAGKSWSLVSSDPPEYVRRVADYVDRRLSETAAVTNLPSARATAPRILSGGLIPFSNKILKSFISEQLTTVQNKTAPLNIWNCSEVPLFILSKKNYLSVA